MHRSDECKADSPTKIGDIETRRKNNDVSFAALSNALPDITEVESQDFHTTSSDGHEILCRWYTRKGSSLSKSSAVCYLHGGGMISISADAYGFIVRKYVQQTGVPFLVVDYRLAPEVQAPRLVEDCYAGLQYLVSHADELGVDPQRIAVMGDSGGGALAAALTHFIKAKGGPELAKQILIYPMLDDRTKDTDPHIETFVSWHGEDNQTAWQAVLGDKYLADNLSPVDAPGRMMVEDASGLPPAYIDVGELDLFRNECQVYAQKLGLAGVSCEFHLFPSVMHGYDIFAPDTEVTRRTMAERYRAITSF
jgi:acetyl esterase/lipase